MKRCHCSPIFTPYAKQVSAQPSSGFTESKNRLFPGVTECWKQWIIDFLPAGCKPCISNVQIWGWKFHNGLFWLDRFHMYLFVNSQHGLGRSLEQEPRFLLFEHSFHSCYRNSKLLCVSLHHQRENFIFSKPWLYFNHPNGSLAEASKSPEQET